MKKLNPGRFSKGKLQVCDSFPNLHRALTITAASHIRATCTSVALNTYLKTKSCATCLLTLDNNVHLVIFVQKFDVKIPKYYIKNSRYVSKQNMNMLILLSCGPKQDISFMRITTELAPGCCKLWQS